MLKEDLLYCLTLHSLGSPTLAASTLDKLRSGSAQSSRLNTSAVLQAWRIPGESPVLNLHWKVNKSGFSY